MSKFYFCMHQASMVVKHYTNNQLQNYINKYLIGRSVVFLALIAQYFYVVDHMEVQILQLSDCLDKGLM